MRPLARVEPRSAASFALAVGVHVLLIAVLFFAISWKTRPPAPVVAELWTQPEAPREVAPPPEPPKPAPQPKPEPKVEPPQTKVDIALEREKEIRRLEEVERKRREDEHRRKELEEKQRKEEDARRLEAEKKRKEEAQRQEAEKKRREDEARAKAARDKQRVAEERRLKEDLERARDQRLKDQLARELGSTTSAARTGTPVAGDAGATAGWVDKIRAKIRGNVVLPPDLPGNPQAVFLVQLLPSGDIVSVRLARSSGNKAVDEAWERAILKSSPLPQPDKREVFQARLELRFSLRDEP